MLGVLACATLSSGHKRDEANAVSMRVISDSDLAELLEKAEASPRRRAIFRLHEHHELVQRMVNAILPGSYVPPHKHEDPDKVELFAVLLGKVAILQFENSGAVSGVHILDARGPLRVVDIPPRTYHALLALEPSALLEIIQGPYHAATHKRFAPWAVEEGSAGAADYLASLEAAVRSRL